MAPFQKIAKHLVAEVPVAKLQDIFKPQSGDDHQGRGCGGGCDGRNGLVCGLSCRPKAGVPGVIDRNGQLKLSAKDLKDVRDNLPKLREALARQIEVHLDQLR